MSLGTRLCPPCLTTHPPPLPPTAGRALPPRACSTSSASSATAPRRRSRTPSCASPAASTAPASRPPGDQPLSPPKEGPRFFWPNVPRFTPQVKRQVVPDRRVVLGVWLCDPDRPSHRHPSAPRSLYSFQLLRNEDHWPPTSSFPRGIPPDPFPVPPVAPLVVVHGWRSTGDRVRRSAACLWVKALVDRQWRSRRPSPHASPPPLPFRVAIPSPLGHRAATTSCCSTPTPPRGANVRPHSQTTQLARLFRPR